MKESEAVEMIGKIHNSLLELTDVVNFLSTEWSRPRMEWSKAKLPTTAPITSAAPTADARSDVDEWMQETAQRLLAASIALLTPPSLQSDTKTADVGLAVPGSECAHEWQNPSPQQWKFMFEAPPHLNSEFMTSCKHCDASMQFVRTPVPVAAPASSTSVSQPSSSSASGLSKVSAELASASPIDPVFPILADSNFNRCTPPHHYFALDRDWCDCGEERVKP